MNEEENRIYCAEDSNKYWSGELSVTQFAISFKPVLYLSWIEAKWSALCKGGTVVKVAQTEFPYPLGCNEENYLWILHKETNVVYRVWEQDYTFKPNNCSLFRKDNTIMLKGIGEFDFSDFTIFDFQ